MQHGEKPVERDDRIIGVSRAGKMVQQRRRDVTELLAREGALEGIISRRAPAPHQSRYFEGVAETHRAQALESVAIIAIRRKDQARMLRAAGPCMLEQTRIMPLHV